MLIISKYRDYYDKVVGTDGIDKTLIFKRELTECKNSEITFNINYNVPSKLSWSRLHAVTPQYTPFIIGFCGKLYIGYKFNWTESTVFKTFEKSEILYDKEKILAKIIKNIKPENIKKIKQQLKDLYTNVHGKDFHEIFQTQNVPYFYATVSNSKLKYVKIGSKYQIKKGTSFDVNKLNPILNDYDFFKLFDPFTAFQEISMFLGGVLGTYEDKTIEIDDKYRMAASGYDKTSFRQSAPGIKKERRRANRLKKQLKKQ
jgi:hypothetical protein